MMKSKENKLSINDIFRRITSSFVDAISSVWAFLFFFVAVLIWLSVGLLFGFTETLQLLLHNVLGIVTLFMVLLLQHNKYRDSRSMHIKLDELLSGAKGSRNEFIHIQQELDEDLDKLEEEVLVNKKDIINSVSHKSKAQKQQRVKKNVTSSNKPVKSNKRDGSKDSA